MKDDMYHWIARHLPNRLVYWCAITLNAHGSTGKYSHVELPRMRVMDAMKRWEVDKLR